MGCHIIWIYWLEYNENERYHCGKGHDDLPSDEHYPSYSVANWKVRLTPLAPPSLPFNSWQYDTGFICLCCFEDMEHQRNRTGVEVTLMREEAWKSHSRLHASLIAVTISSNGFAMVQVEILHLWLISTLNRLWSWITSVLIVQSR
jgi:hypothetical protein